MLIRYFHKSVGIDIDKYEGQLAVELSLPIFIGNGGQMPSVVHKCDGKSTKVEPSEVNETFALFFLSPPDSTATTHTYMLIFEGVHDATLTYPVYKFLTLIEHNSSKRFWELVLEDSGTRIIMPSSFRAVQEVQES